ncbi:N-acetylmuramoyl-L-alanine amidase family protein [Intestinibacillus massiliensis]|uniref:N-acetylmuramoyl-L-alanine amidase family protein n=1 Tax=Intestinibacillus massiliensis TaxID=1871029 RepID=UPI0013565F11|nr:N-acetylmuramoyl-L-alanine amidase [Intestinibacillus massiliensis]
MKIMLDPGHGGSDPGACNGIHHEAVYALDIAKRLGALLTAQGMAVRYTRQSDIHVGINERYKAANAWGADGFVSIHLNSAQPSASGVETLVYRDTGKAAHLAALVQGQVIKSTGTKNRGVKERPDLGVLRGTDMPAILVETGFISNPDECTKLATACYRQTVAEAIARGVCFWAEITYKEDDDMYTVYKTIQDVPDWARECVNDLIAKGYLKGDGDGQLDLEHYMLRGLVINWRAGLYK